MSIGAGAGGMSGSGFGSPGRGSCRNEETDGGRSQIKSLRQCSINQMSSFFAVSKVHARSFSATKICPIFFCCSSSSVAVRLPLSPSNITTTICRSLNPWSLRLHTTVAGNAWSSGNGTVTRWPSFSDRRSGKFSIFQRRPSGNSFLPRLAAANAGRRPFAEPSGVGEIFHSGAWVEVSEDRASLDGSDRFPVARGSCSEAMPELAGL